MEILKELNVEKLNIVEPDGTVKMTLFNTKNMPKVFFDGEEVFKGHRQDDNTAGLMFYDENGVECGGLIFGGKNGVHSMGLTMDKQNIDQVLQIASVETPQGHKYGIKLSQRPDKNFRQYEEELNLLETLPAEEAEKLAKQINIEHATRLSILHEETGKVGITIFDSKGIERIVLAVDENDVPSIKIMNERGDVVKQL